MDFFDTLNWRLTKFLLSCFGAWPFQTLWRQRIIRSVVFILFISLFIPEILKLFMARNDVNLIVECAPIFALHSLTITKMLQCLCNSGQIKKLLINVQKDWESNLSPYEFEILRSHSQRSRKIMQIYVYFIFIVTAMYMFTPMIPKILDYIVPLNESRSKIVLYQTEYFIDSDKYEIPILLHAYIVTPFPTTIIVAFDTLYANCIHHACSMFTIIGNRLQNITYLKYRRSEGDSLGTEKSDARFLIKCIEQHTEALEYARILESTYTIPMVFILGINMLAMSITGLQTVLKLNEPFEVMRFGIYTIGQVVHLFFLCQPGQKLMDQSGQILQSMFQGEWYTLPPKLRRHYIFMIMRGRKSCQLTAGKICPMSLQSFGLIVKTSASYCTILISLR